MDGLVLGIDLGTTSVKITLLHAQRKTIVGNWSRSTDATVESNVGSIGYEQDPVKIIDALQICLNEVSDELLRRVVSVGVCGQMHGIVLWKNEDVGGGGWGRDEVTGSNKIELSRISHTNLYTWQDARCTPEFISTLPPSTSHLRVASGFGCVTLFWLSRKRPTEYIQAFNCAGTIQDMLVMILCEHDRVTMSVQNAASWGYFNTINNTWNIDTLEAERFPTHFLPTVVRPGNVVGQTTRSWCSIPAHVPVFVAMGDLQCSALPKLEADNDAVLNVSTSAQLAVKMSPGFIPRLSGDDGDAHHPAIDYFPFFDDIYLAVAASLNGGNVLASLVRMIQHWTTELGVGLSEEEIWSKLHLLGSDDSKVIPNPLSIRPTIYGERHNPRLYGIVKNITPDSTSLRSVYHATSRGIILNIFEMMPSKFLRTLGVRRIQGVGSTLVKNLEMQRAVIEISGLPLIMVEEEEVGGCEAAVGAALAVVRSLEKIGNNNLYIGTKSEIGDLVQ